MTSQANNPGARDNNNHIKLPRQVSIPINLQLSDCLKQIKYDLCARCSYHDLSYLHNLGMTNFTRPSDIIHNYSRINELLCPSASINHQMIDNYFNDLEHGFLHGLCCCFIAYLINASIQPQTWVSIILHDFLKSSLHPQSAHDSQLKNIFGKLLPITYRHSKIKLLQPKWVMVKADRIELRRYSDYLNWVDDRYTHTITSLNQHQRLVIDHFYTQVRPILLYFYSNRNQVFIRHGYEKCQPPYDYKGTYPPQTSLWHKSDLYAVEIDSEPFSNEIYIGKAEWDNRLMWQDNHCSNHGGRKLWNKIKGFMTINDFNALGGTLHSIRTRDHLMGKSHIPISDWFFMVNNITDTEMPIMNYLKSTNARTIDQSIIFDMFHIKKLLYNRLTALNTTKVSTSII